MIIVYVTLYVSVTTKHIIQSTIVTNPCLKFRITNVCKYNWLTINYKQKANDNFYIHACS